MEAHRAQSVTSGQGGAAAPASSVGAVSVIMTVLDEAEHLSESVSGIQRQDWPGEMQIVIALGPSSDGTDALAEDLARSDPRIELVANPSGRTPSGLNRALALARHPVVVRVDGHCVLPENYISAAVTVLERTRAANVGGIMAAEGGTPFERAAAIAMRSKLGVGAAAFHVGGEAGPAETVYLGVFRRQAMIDVGGYDERFERAQDWELNHRIRSAGGIVWFTPDLSVVYRPRSSVPALARQYLNYGRWRRQIMRSHRGTTRARYLAPPVAVVTLAVGVTAGLIGVTVGPRWMTLGWAAPAAYLMATAVGGAVISASEPLAVRVRVPVALATMHCAWGTGFLLGLR